MTGLFSNTSFKNYGAPEIFYFSVSNSFFPICKRRSKNAREFVDYFPVSACGWVKGRNYCL